VFSERLFPGAKFAVLETAVRMLHKPANRRTGHTLAAQ
jgi:hypothetical protein